MKQYEAFTAIITMAVATVLPMGAFQQPASPDASALQDPPTTPVVVVTPTRPCEVQGPIIRIPSQSAPDGIQLRLVLPATARYPEGAPIAVHSTANASIDRVNGCLRGQGFVEVVYQCPSARDARLTSCSEPLADVLAFATGRIRSLENKSIDGYTGDVKAYTANVGLVGWSAGGNRAVLTIARYRDRFPGLKWYASWESPMLSVGDGGGSGTIYQPNPFYDSSAGTVDLNRLRYSAEMPLWVWPPQGVPCAPDDCPRGGLYLEGDGNGRFTRDSDYAFWVAYESLEVGQPRKAFYSSAIIREARDRQLFGPTWPSHIATPEEVEQRENAEDALRHVRDAVRRLPHLAVMVFESEVGHVGVSADHPHAIAQVNAWLSARARWVRFQPDAHYLEWVMKKRPTRIVQFPAGKGLDRDMIASMLEPEAANGGPSDEQGMASAVAELADRTHRNNWTTELPAVLIKW
jgi:hypothetical protein